MAEPMKYPMSKDTIEKLCDIADSVDPEKYDDISENLDSDTFVEELVKIVLDDY